MKRKILVAISAWFIFVGIDFIFHASLLQDLWKQDLPALKSLEQLAQLIPAGYASFLLLCLLMSYVYFRFYQEKPAFRESLKFGLIFGGLFAASNLLGLYSYIDLPMKHLIVINLVYFIEMLAVVAVFSHSFSFRKPWRILLFAFLGLLSMIIIGALLQNFLQYGNI